MVAQERRAEIERLYRQRFGHNLAYRRRVWKVLQEGLFRPRMGNPKVVVDVGSGYGDFVNLVPAPTRYAIDVNPSTRDYLDDGVTLLEQDATQPWPIEAGTVDLVFTSNFFEHLPDKESVSRVLREAHRVLRPGGRIVALGPNIRYVPHRYWDYWDHTLALTEHALDEGMEANGFRVVESLGRTIPYTMKNVRELPEALLALYLRMPFVWRFFGHQFLVTGEKP